MENWKALTLEETQNLNEPVNQLHRAAQFLAMFGNAYLPKASDDSQNNLGWNRWTNCIAGRWINDAKIRLVLDVLSFELVIEQKNTEERIALDGWTKEQVFSMLIDALKGMNMDVRKYKPITQFTIPQHPIDQGASFNKPEVKILEEWAAYQSNAQLVLGGIAPRFSRASEIRIWPHHFDMGLYIPVGHDSDGAVLQSVGAGLAIADAYVNEPYFYINHWSKEVLEEVGDLTPVNGLGYWNLRDWKGLVLPTSTLGKQPADQQKSALKLFFQEGINQSMEILKNQIVKQVQ